MTKQDLLEPSQTETSQAARLLIGDRTLGALLRHEALMGEMTGHAASDFASDLVLVLYLVADWVGTRLGLARSPLNSNPLKSGTLKPSRSLSHAQQVNNA